MDKEFIADLQAGVLHLMKQWYPNLDPGGSDYRCAFCGRRYLGYLTSAKPDHKEDCLGVRTIAELNKFQNEQENNNE